MLSHPMTRLGRSLLLAVTVAATGAAVAACGEKGISASLTGQDRESAELFVERCSGCHTLSITGADGSTTNVRSREYKDGPNFDQRKETASCVLFAIRNGGFSGGPMPQNIVTGPEAEALAEFVANNSGRDVVETPGEDSAAGTDCPTG
jgi:hypothetical protein